MVRQENVHFYWVPLYTLLKHFLLFVNYYSIAASKTE